jgi:hypothetical protein
MNFIIVPMKFSIPEHSLCVVCVFGGGGGYSTLASDGLGRLKPGIHILDWSTR